MARHQPLKQSLSASIENSKAIHSLCRECISRLNNISLKNDQAAKTVLRDILNYWDIETGSPIKNTLPPHIKARGAITCQIVAAKLILDAQVSEDYNKQVENLIRKAYHEVTGEHMPDDIKEINKHRQPEAER